MGEKPDSIVIDFAREEDIEIHSEYEIESTEVHHEKKKSGNFGSFFYSSLS
jgi:hypothetical protein